MVKVTLRVWLIGLSDESKSRPWCVIVGGTACADASAVSRAMEAKAPMEAKAASARKCLGRMDVLSARLSGRPTSGESKYYVPNGGRGILAPSMLQPRHPF